MTSLTTTQTEFIESVLELSPRVATFDCDGTLWSGDAGEGFFWWELDQELVSPEISRWARARYSDYRAGKVPEDIMCGEMVTLHNGMREGEIQQACDTYFTMALESTVFPDMRELVRRLLDSGCDVWAVSSSSHWIIRSGMRSFGIPHHRILAAEAAVEDGIVSDRLVRVPSGPGKVEAIESVIGAPPDCAFGNAIWDREMLTLAKKAFAINPNPNLLEIALENQWTVYQPDGSR
jgi:phosphoserine phosphatase